MKIEDLEEFDFESALNQYRYAGKAIAEKYRKELMNKNERIEVKPIMNGYLVEYSYRLPAKEGKDYSYDYKEEEYSFKTWDEVVEFVRNKPMDTPPATI